MPKKKLVKVLAVESDERIVVFSNGPNQIRFEDQRKVVDLLIDHLGLEVRQNKRGVYSIQKQGRRK
jgi:hypothetical protein